MDWKILITTFGAVFLAEMADKTQLVTMNLTAKSGKPLTVFAGSVLGYAAAATVSVILGATLARVLKPEWIQWGGGALFVVLGVLMITGKL